MGDGPPGDGEIPVIQSHITNNITGADTTAAQFRGFIVEEGSTITIGSLGTSLQMDLKDVATYYEALLGGTGVSYLDIDNYHEINVMAAAASPGTGLWGLNLLGAHDADDTGGRGTINIYASSNQSIGIGAEPAGDMEVNKIVAISGNVTVGAAVTENDDSTAPDIDIQGADVTTKCALGTVVKTAGTWTHEDGIVATYYGSDGTTNYNSDGTLTNGYGSGGDIFTLANNPDTVTISNYELREGASYLDPYKKGTLTNGIDLNRCTIQEVTLDLGNHITVTPSAI